MTDYSKLVEALNRLWQVQDDDLEDWVYGSQQAMCDAAAAIEALQAEVKRLELDNEDYEYTLRERYDEPKRGEWVEDTTTYAGPGLSNYKCSLCGKICGTWRRELKPSELPNWCGNCGADMRTMEVQDEGTGSL